jgi:predicted enzyme related to lactoylglutathione lyase
MTTIEKHTPGSFCWIELTTTDQNAAKNFYGKLFGWEATDTPMGPGESYTIFKLRGRDAAAAYTMREDQKAEGVPPNWLLYVAVENADAAVERAKQLGAKVHAEPFDVMDFGRMAVLQDPTGAVFAVWQAKKHTGTGITGEKGTLCWADLNTPDPEAASRFYSQLFGWKLEKSEQDSSGYLHIKNGDQYIGGIPPVQHRNPNAPSHWLAYFEIANCDTATATAKQLGAKTYMDPMTMENVGRWSVLADPQGAVFAAFQVIPHEQAVKAS